MVMPQIVSRSFLSRQNDLLFFVSVLAVLGTSGVLIGGIWDSASHALKIPDSFWTIQHVTVYTGVSIVAFSAAFGTVLSLKNRKVILGMIFLLAGSAMQLGGGYVDYNFHQIYGIDGLVTSSHLTIESGLLLTSIGGFLTLAKFGYNKTKKVVPFAIVNMIFSATWIGFNLSLLIGATMLCIPIYDLFSSGCSVM
ncbi:hypothetical protein DYY66_0294 [Candidatus Nitrosotalea sp. FS]|uniref:hypothetical protein n=1 Tax=Candidatus Nitrosotalea sp. FS TaxID=2341021 RepID=UPI00140BBD95|nr:hypothetical protein [Candidatus Nitrosotalea sp. FS]NHH98597.1 hypothetical protein [Candidatus Nitrosotalea sp. FS]